MVVAGFVAASLPVSLFFVWMGFHPDLIPEMAGVLEQFFIHLGVYGTVSFCLFCYALWKIWAHKRDN